MGEKIFLFGISERCQKIINNGTIDIKNVVGLFDNSSDKWGHRYALQCTRYVEILWIICDAKVV